MIIEIKIPDVATKEITEAVDSMQTQSEVKKLNAVSFWLIKQCVETNSEKMAIYQDKVTVLEKPVGKWKITVEKV